MAQVVDDVPLRDAGPREELAEAPQDVAGAQGRAPPRAEDQVLVAVGRSRPEPLRRLAGAVSLQVCEQRSGEAERPPPGVGLGRLRPPPGR